jgi:hypothetical protein
MANHTNANDPQTGDSLSAQHAGNLTSEPEMREGQQQDQDGTTLDNPDDSIGGPPTGEHVDDTGGLTTQQMQADETTCATAKRAE